MIHYVSVFAIPGDLYKNTKSKKISKEYKNFAYTKYNKYIKVGPNYELLKPDLIIKCVLIKEKIPVNVVLFIKEPIIEIENKKIKLSSSNYLFEVNLNGNPLPDLHFMDFESENRKDAVKAADLIKDFYIKNGWQAHIYKKEIKRKLKCKFPRFPKGVNVYKSDDIIEIAKIFGYNKNKLYFPKSIFVIS